jgi:hypothetical protein
MPASRLRSLAFASLLLVLGCGEDDPTAPGAPPADPGDTVTATTWNPGDFAVVLDVGPGQSLADPSQVPWESLAPSTLVRIHYRAQPYRTKWVINTAATAATPVVVLGVRDPVSGARPVISGDGAVTRLALDYWNEGRSVVKIGGSNLPSDDVVPAYVHLQGLEIRSGRPGYTFTDDAGAAGTYSTNAAAVHAEVGAHVTIEDCVLADCGNGLFASAQVSDLVVRGNYIHDNGIEGSIYEHNSYTECLGILFEYNRYGPLRPGCGGNNLKDRSAGTVIRYNWIEAGNRQLDLVETDYVELRDDPRYHATFVYGNLLIENETTGNSQIVHYGGDGGDEAFYRKGTLHFYHNTVYSTRPGNTTLLRLSTADESADVRNTVVHVTSGGAHLAINADAGAVALHHCWLTTGWRNSHEGAPSGTVTAQDCLVGADPGFADAAGLGFVPLADSPLHGAGGPLAPAAAPYPVAHQYHEHQAGVARGDGSAPAIGAYAVPAAARNGLVPTQTPLPDR